MKARTLALLALIALFALGAIPLAHASAGGSGEAPDFSTLVWPAVNVSIYLALIVYLYRKHGRVALKDRSRSFVKTLESSQEELSAAERELAAEKKRFESLAAEQTELIDGLKKEGENISRRIADEAKRTARAIESELSRRIEKEHAEALRDIRRQVVVGAAERVRSLLREEVSEQEDKRLRANAIKILTG